VTSVDAAVTTIVGPPTKLTPAELTMLAEAIVASLTVEVQEIPPKFAERRGWVLNGADPEDTTVLGVRIGWVCCMDPTCDATPGLTALYPMAGETPDKRFADLLAGTRVMNGKASDLREKLEAFIKEQGWGD